jgi:predicted protein tyrosine phosphatase
VIVIEICSREEAGEILSSATRRDGVVLLVSIGEAHDPTPAGYANVHERMRFLFADTTAEESGPTVDDVRRLIGAAQSLASQTAGRVIIHCQAGISRSTAAAVIFYAVLLGHGSEEEAMARVLAAREYANPNRRMIALADALLEREGRLIAAVERALGNE